MEAKSTQDRPNKMGEGGSRIMKPAPFIILFNLFLTLSGPLEKTRIRRGKGCMFRSCSGISEETPLKPKKPPDVSCPLGWWSSLATETKPRRGYGPGGTSPAMF